MENQEFNPTTETEDFVPAYAPDEDFDDSRLIELVGSLVQGIVAHPEEVEVEEFFDEIGTVYGVRVHPDDIGRVIGREGRVANALRNVVKAAATKMDVQATVEILTDEDDLEVPAEPQQA